MWELVEGPALRTQLAGQRFRAVDRLGALLAIEARHVAAREHRPHHAVRGEVYAARLQCLYDRRLPLRHRVRPPGLP